MSGTTPAGQGWTPAEAEVIGRVLREGQEALLVGPAPWAALERRRSRAARRTLPVVAAAVLAVAALVVAVVGPDTLGRRIGLVAPSAVFEPQGGVIGSLADDTVWIRALEEQTRRRARGVVEGDLSVVRVVVATDVPGARLALVTWPHSAGIQWLHGPPRADVTQMNLWSGCSSDEPCSVLWGRGWTDAYPVILPDGSLSDEPVPWEGDGIAIATAPGMTVVVRAGNDVSPDGRLSRWSATAREAYPGVHVLPLASAQGRLDVEVRRPDGTPAQSAWSSSGGSGPDDWWDTAGRPAAAPAARGDGVPEIGDRGDLRGDLMMAVSYVAGIVPADGSRVVWASSDATRASAVLALRAPSGGYVLAGVERVAPDPGSFRVAVYAPRAAAVDGVDRAGLAWRDGDRFVVVAPAGAAAARWEVDGRPRDGLPALGSDGAVTGDGVPAGDVRVRFLDADGGPVGEPVDLAVAWPDGVLLR